MSTKDIVAVIPAYNEELTIGSVVLLTNQTAGKTIVVDDGSVDRTSEIASRAGADVIRLDKNQGKAKAVMTGLLKARDLNPSVVVLLDADGQNNPSEISQVIEPILDGRADLVIGSRFMDGVSDVPKLRRFGQKTLDYTHNLGSAFKTTDSQSGFRALSRRALSDLDFTSEDYNIESDMIHYFSEKGLKIVEVPVTVRYDVPHKHKSHPLSHGWGLLSNIIGFIGYRRPLVSFGLAGMIFTIAGTGLGLWAFEIYDTTHKFPIAHSLMSALLIILGLLMISSGLILNSLVFIIKSRR
jgi:glycosyltransferase involved in cell wall biosynthesis